MNAPVIKQPKRPPLAEIPFDRRAGDLLFVRWQTALGVALYRSASGRRHQVRRFGVTLWAVQEIR